MNEYYNHYVQDMLHDALSEADHRELSLCRWTKGPWQGQLVLQDRLLRNDTFHLYDTGGTLITQVPNGEWEMIKVIGDYDGGDDGFLELVEQANAIIREENLDDSS